MGDSEFSFADEFKGLDFGDHRLKRRFVKMTENILEKPTAIIQKSQTSFAEMMGAYRLVDKKKVSPEKILHPHQLETKRRMEGYDTVLALQDTTSICLSSLLSTTGLGSIGMGAFGGSATGLFLHNTIAVSLNGTPLGILEQEMWSRGEVEGQEKVSERLRWLNGVSQSVANTKVICVADREADGADFFASAKREGVEYVVRAKEKLRKSAKHKEKVIAQTVEDGGSKGIVEFKIRYQKKAKAGDKSHRPRFERDVRAEIFFGQVTLLEVKRASITPLPTEEERTLNAVWVKEINPPVNHDAVNWLLFTSLPIDDVGQAKKVIDIYRVRWTVEIFHKVLKSVCKVESVLLENADRIKNLFTILSIVAWRLHVLTNAAREFPDKPCTEVLTETEWHALHLHFNRKKPLPKKPPSLYEAVRTIAKLGGFIGRKSDGEPGVLTIAEGWIRLKNFAEMLETAQLVYKR